MDDDMYGGGLGGVYYHCPMVHYTRDLVMVHTMIPNESLTSEVSPISVVDGSNIITARSAMAPREPEGSGSRWR